MISKVTANGWILPTGGVASGRVCTQPANHVYLQLGTVQYNAVQYNTLQYRTVQ